MVTKDMLYGHKQNTSHYVNLVQLIFGDAMIEQSYLHQSGSGIQGYWAFPGLNQNIACTCYFPFLFLPFTLFTKQMNL